MSDESTILKLFPKSRIAIFKIPNLPAGTPNNEETYRALFLNELLALETCAKRNLVPATYIRHPDGSANISVSDIVLDVSSFYLFAHKTLVSAIFILAKTIPHDQARGINFRSYTKFTKNVLAGDDDISQRLRKQCGKNLSWAQAAIIDKRDDLIQHWQGNASSKFFTSIFAWDVPYLVYYSADYVKKIDDKKVNSVLAQVKTKVKADLDGQADSLQKIAWMEAWQSKVSSQVQTQIASLMNNDLFIALPVTPSIVEKLDTTIACLLNEAVKIREQYATDN